MKFFAATLAVLLSIGPSSAQLPDSQVYRVTFDYHFVNVRGEVQRRERVQGRYARDQQKKTVTWTNITLATSRGMGEFGPAAPKALMEGFAYPLRTDARLMLTDAFYKGIPATAMHERNLVLDTRMFEMFGEDSLDRLKPDAPYQFDKDHQIDLAGAGTFKNRDLQLRLTGTAVRNGKECAIVDYVALFNPLELTLPGFRMVGRSHYWGQVWVSRADKQLEYATLYEDVLGEVRQHDGQPQPTNIFRSGTLERVAR